MRKKDKKKELKLDESNLEGVFKDAMIQGHKCVFNGKMISLDKMLKSEKQFNLCLLCRLGNLLLGQTMIMKAVKKIRLDIKELKRKQCSNSEEEELSYIG